MLNEGMHLIRFLTYVRNDKKEEKKLKLCIFAGEKKRKNDITSQNNH